MKDLETTLVRTVHSLIVHNERFNDIDQRFNDIDQISCVIIGLSNFRLIVLS